MSELLVEARNITKRFPGVVALDRVSLRVVAGQVNALVGENGAGKSTLMNILSGVYTDYEGELLVDGEVQHFNDVTGARQKGIAIIHQELNYIPYLSVAENIFLGREPLNRLGLVDHSIMHRQARQLLERLHSDIDTRALMIDLRVGEQQLVEIAKALSFNARVLIMDEPTSSLSEGETKLLFGIIRELKSQCAGIVYISHKMDEISELADFVTVLRDGKFVDEVPMADTSIDDIVRKMVGRERKDFFVKQAHPIGKVVLECDGLCLKDEVHPDRYRLENVKLEVRSGEVLGIYGLMGAGRTELFETIFGLHPSKASGVVKVDGKQVIVKHPEDAVHAGLALIPEDRKTAGLVLGMDIEKNTTLAALSDFLTLNLVDGKKEHKTAEAYRKQLGIKSYGTAQLTGELSGGNQQKVVLAKWMLTGPKVLLLDEPTRGIDINAKNEIYRLMDRLASEGMALIVVSSELPEIMAVSDRIITLREGRIGKEFYRDEFTEDAILQAALPADAAQTSADVAQTRAACD